MNSTSRTSGARRGQTPATTARDSGANALAPAGAGGQGTRNLRTSGSTHALRVLIDARKIEHGGIGVYTRNLIRGLLELNNLRLPHFPSVELSLLGNSELLQHYDFFEQVSVLEENSKPYSVDELCFLGRRLARRIEASAIDIAHFPHFVLPFRLPVPAVVTVHDLIHLQQPQRRYYPWIAKPLIRSTLRRAEKVLTVSQASRSALLQLFADDALALRKLRLIPNAIDPYFLRRLDDWRDGVSRPVLKHLFEQQSPYFFSLFSTLKPHKGLDDLLVSFAAVKRELSMKRLMTIHRARRDGAEGADTAPTTQALKLVIAGQGLAQPEGRASVLAPETRALLASPELKGEVIILGQVSKQELYHLYAQAQALVLPSLSEGFSLPVIEAQAVGTPVIARPVPAIMELLSEHDTVAADMSREALEDVLRSQLAASQRFAQRPATDARARLLSRFDQLEISRMILTVYQEVLGSSAQEVVST